MTTVPSATSTAIARRSEARGGRWLVAAAVIMTLVAVLLGLLVWGAYGNLGSLRRRVDSLESELRDSKSDAEEQRRKRAEVERALDDLRTTSKKAEADLAGKRDELIALRAALGRAQEQPCAHLPNVKATLKNRGDKVFLEWAILIETTASGAEVHEFSLGDSNLGTFLEPGEVFALGEGAFYVAEAQKPGVPGEKRIVHGVVPSDGACLLDVRW